MRKFFTFLVVLFIALSGKTQTADLYIFSSASGATLDPMSGATNLIGSGVDDTPSPLAPIGFTFLFEGTAYTEFSVTPDGFIKLGAPAAVSQFTNATNSTTNIPKLFAYWDDLATGVDGNVQYLVTGSAPNRILKVEWFVTIPRATGGNANTKFQIWLYETTNVIEFRYGGTPAGTTPSASVGIRGAQNSSVAGVFKFINITTSSHTASNSAENNTNTAYPLGMIYTFTPPAACTATPSAGTAVANRTMVCAGDTTLISLQGATTGFSGLTYVWESSPDNTVWTPVPGATNATYIPVVSSSTWYRAIITCTGFGSDTSTPVQITTSAPVPLPVSEGFNTSAPSVFPTCWTQQYVVGASNITFQTNSNNPVTTPFEGSRYVYWNSFSISNNNETRLVSPKIVTTGTASVDVEFYMFNNHNTTYSTGQYLLEGVQVQYSMDGLSWTDAGPLFQRHDPSLAPGTAQWNKKTVTLPAAAGNQPGIFVGFKFHSGFGDNTSIDAVMILATPDCPTPSAVSVGSITDISASVSFTCVNCTGSYIVEYGPTGFTPGTGTTAGTGGTIVTGAASPIQITGLTGSTNYDVYVRQDCGTSVGLNSSPVVSFLTLCTPPTLSSTTPGTRCGPGTVVLAATGSAGSTLAWYTSATGGVPVGTGSFFTTPVLGATTDFYVAAASGPGSSNVGLSPTATNCGTITLTTATDWPLRFNTTTQVTINSAWVIPSAAGTFNVALRNALSTANLQTASFTFSAADVGVPVQIPLGFTITTPGSYQLTNTSGGGHRIGTFTCSYPFTTPSGGFSIVGSATTSTSVTNTNTYNIFYNLNVSEGCESPRQLVVATVTPGPAFTVTQQATVCNDAVKQLTVTSNPADFDSFEWSPQAGLFTDAAGTVPYTGGSATTVYFRSATPGEHIITASALNNTSQCTGIDSVTVTVLPVMDIVASPSQICVSGNSTLSLTPGGDMGSATFQWFSSTDGTTFTPITNATGTSYTTATLTATTYFRAEIRDASGAVCQMITDTIPVSDPQVLSTTPNGICSASGTVDLQATSSPGMVLNWYENPTGGVPVGTGTLFTTPTLNTTTTYYVAAGTPPSNSVVGLSPTATNCGTIAAAAAANFALRFNTTAPVTIQSAWIIPVTSGTFITALREAPSTNDIYLATFNVLPAMVGQPVEIPLNFVISDPGSYQLINIQGNAHRIATFTCSYPMTSGSLSIVGSAASSTAATNTTTYNTYFWLNIVESCESPRVPVTATVNAFTTINTQPQSQAVCAGATVVFDVDATGANLTYQWMLNGAPITGATASSYTINNATPADNGDYSVVITGLCGTETSSVATLAVSPSNAWLGAVSGDWGTAANWCGGIPNSTTDVVIPAGTPFSPVINGLADVRNITVNSGATLSTSANATFSIYGNLVNNGTLNTTSGFIFFKGISVQNISALDASTVTVNGAGITLTGPMTTTTLILQNGNIALGAHDLTTGSSVNGSLSSHIITNGAGELIITSVGVSPVIFPVGPDAASYNPVIIANGQGRNFNVRVKEGVNPSITNNSFAVNRTWTVIPSTALPADAQITFQYDNAHGNSGFNAAQVVEIGLFNGAIWTIASPDNGIAAMGASTARQVTILSRQTGDYVITRPGGITYPTSVAIVNPDITGIVLMPNAVQSNTVLRITARRALNINWDVVDASGRVIMSFSTRAAAGTTDIPLDFTRLKSGIYFLTGYSGAGRPEIVRFIRL